MVLRSKPTVGLGNYSLSMRYDMAYGLDLTQLGLKSKRVKICNPDLHTHSDIK